MDISHFVYFAFPPAEVFALLADETQHAAFSGEAASIEPKIGGQFAVFDGKVSGKILELKPDERLVLEWRGDDWPSGHTSHARFDLEAMNDGRGCALTLHHSGVPEDRRAQIDEGWKRYYWQPMADYLRNAKVAVVRRFLEGFKNQARLEVVDETWSEDCVLHVPGFNPPPGREAQKEVGRVIFSAFTKVHVDVIDTIVEGDRVVERHHAKAFHTGEFFGIAATGKQVSWTENHIYRMKDGLIAETWSEVSFHDLISQISGATVSA